MLKRTEMQVSRDEHIELEPQVLQFTNHSCQPSVFFDTDAMKVIALKDLQVGDEVRRRQAWNHRG